MVTLSLKKYESLRRYAKLSKAVSRDVAPVQKEGIELALGRVNALLQLAQGVNAAVQENPSKPKRARFIFEAEFESKEQREAYVKQLLKK